MHSLSYIWAVRFSDWFAMQPRGRGLKTARVAGVGTTTIYQLVRGVPLRRYDVARRISAATGGAVSIEELCAPREQPSEPPPAGESAA